MNDENPYRFGGEATSDRTHDASPGSYVRPDGPPILSPGEIRRVAFDRAGFVWTLPLVFAWSVAAYVMVPREVFEALLHLPHIDARAVSIASFFAHLPAIVFAYRMQAFSNRSRLAALILAALLLAPYLKFAVAFFLLYDSRQILTRHGIRMGLLRVEHGSLPGRDAR